MDNRSDVQKIIDAFQVITKWIFNFIKLIIKGLLKIGDLVGKWWNKKYVESQKQKPKKKKKTKK